MADASTDNPVGPPAYNVGDKVRFRDIHDGEVVAVDGALYRFNSDRWVGWVAADELAIGADRA